MTKKTEMLPQKFPQVKCCCKVNETLCVCGNCQYCKQLTTKYPYIPRWNQTEEERKMPHIWESQSIIKAYIQSLKKAKLEEDFG